MDAAEARRIYKREWNRKNRDKVKAAQDRYWQRKAEQAAAAEQAARQDTAAGMAGEMAKEPRSAKGRGIA